MIVIRVDAHFIFLKIKCVFTIFNCLQFVMTVKVWPAPEATVNDVR